MKLWGRLQDVIHARHSAHLRHRQVLARTARVRHEDVIAGDHAITKGAERSGRGMNEMKSRELRRL